MEAPTKAELKKLKVVELRQKLAEFGESQSGLKDVLVNRLFQYYTKKLGDSESKQDGGEEGKVDEPIAMEEEASKTVVKDKQEAEAEETKVPSHAVPAAEEPTTPIAPTVISSPKSPPPSSVPSSTPPTLPTVPPSTTTTTLPPPPKQPLLTGAPPPPPQLIPPPVARGKALQASIAEMPPPKPSPVQAPRSSDSGLEDTGDESAANESGEPVAMEMHPVAMEMPPAAMETRPVPLMSISTSGSGAFSAPSRVSDYYSDAERDQPMSAGVLGRQPTQNSMEALPQDRPVESKGGKRKKKKKKRRRHNQQSKTEEPSQNEEEESVEIEYVTEDPLKPDDPNYRQFNKIFEAFKLTDDKQAEAGKNVLAEMAAKSAESGRRLMAGAHRDVPDDDEEEEEKEPPKISKKKLRKLNRLSVAQLKQLVDRPDVVEMHDVTAQDPSLLIHLKSTRNTVPVPRHWCFKRKYLQGKRGIEKPPFDLPDFIKATGVMEMRQALEEKEDQKSLKQKTRERVRPKMGKLTIDYQKLHDAFFKWQTKPKMSIHGDIYYEGKEFETRLRQKKPGELSDELRRALGMPTGVGKQKFPPPWLIAMQRYGPPPSYPNLKVPGLNAPIPEGCSFGYFVGGWGKPPVDEAGRPLYGDVFGLEQQELVKNKLIDESNVDKSLWGELESEEEEEEEEDESEEEDEDEEQGEDVQTGLVTPIGGLVTPSGLTSIPAGLETPEMIQLRKKKIEEAMEQGGETPVLYTVLPEKQASVGGAMMGSAHVYDLATAASAPSATKKTTAASGDGVEVALDPSELDLDAATMSARYEEQLQSQLQKEDLSDMVAEHAAKQKNKRKRAAATAEAGKATKKLKEFKF